MGLSIVSMDMLCSAEQVAWYSTVEASGNMLLTDGLGPRHRTTKCWLSLSVWWLVEQIEIEPD